MASQLGIMLAKFGELRRNARMTREQFEAMKLAKFRRLVRYVNERSPYYAQLIKDRSIDLDRCVPTDFPPLTKSVLMTNFDRIATDRRVTKQGVADFLTRSQDPCDLFLEEFRIIHTSGSSGEVGYFVYSKEDWARGVAQGMRQRDSRSFRPKRKNFGRYRIAFYGAVGGHFAGVTMLSSARRGFARLFMKVGLYEVNSPMSETVAQLNKFQPDVLSGYTGALTMLAAKQREGVLRIAPIAVGTAGEGMSPTDKKTLEDAFGCEAYNGYGSSEHLMMGGVTPGGSSMLLYDDELMYEMFDDHTLVTNLFNFTLPLIRYRMADILRPVTHKTDPNSPYLEIESLVGRTETMPMFVNQDGVEDFIHPISIAELFVAGVTRFQMQLTGTASFRFVVCLDLTLTASRRSEAIASVNARLRELLAQKKMSNVMFEVMVVDDIPVNPRSRKFQLIVDARSSSGTSVAAMS